MAHENKHAVRLLAFRIYLSFLDITRENHTAQVAKAPRTLATTTYSRRALSRCWCSCCFFCVALRRCLATRSTLCPSARARTPRRCCRSSRPRVCAYRKCLLAFEQATAVDSHARIFMLFDDRVLSSVWAELLGGAQPSGARGCNGAARRTLRLGLPPDG